jgi:putative tricarboxylic transport membrane protein
MSKLKTLMVAAVAVTAMTSVQAEPNKPECIAPAQPGGGFDLTCRLAVTALRTSGNLKAPMRTVYMPGGIGAVAYNNVVTQRPGEAGTIVAFSGGSLLNLAQGKFGRYDVNAVRWLAAIGADYGAAIVRDDSPFKTLPDLMNALKADPTKVVMGAGGSVGSQDWMKAALTAKAADVDFRKMRFVAFEGGGEAVTALRGGHIQAYMGDAAEARTLMDGGAPIRLLAVYHTERLPGKMSTVPTAKEQGYDIEWPIIRGFYVGPKVPDADYNWWVEAFNKTMATPEFAKEQELGGLFPFNRTGADLDKFVKERTVAYGELAKTFGLVK